MKKACLGEAARLLRTHLKRYQTVEVTQEDTLRKGWEVVKDADF